MMIISLPHSVESMEYFFNNDRNYTLHKNNDLFYTFYIIYIFAYTHLTTNCINNNHM